MDIHLDTSWCPGCDRQILPRKYSVADAPSPQSTTLPPPSSATSTNLHQLPTNPPPHTSSNPVRHSQTVRGKHGTIKARVQGGGLINGTGRVRPGGGLRREPSTSGKHQNAAAAANSAARTRSPQKRLSQQHQNQPAATVNHIQRVVIDQAPTPLYCSEECRLADKNGFDIDAAAAIISGTKRKSIISPKDVCVLDDQITMRVGTHPSQENPATASPPGSPIYPPAPPNSVLDYCSWESQPPPDKLARALSVAETSSSSGSSASGRSFGTSNASEINLSHSPEFRVIDPMLTDPAPPDVPPMPLHPHRPSAPARKPPVTRRTSSTSSVETGTSHDGGIFMAARRLSSLFLGFGSEQQRKADQDQRQLRSLSQALVDPSRGPRGPLGQHPREDLGRSEPDVTRRWVASTHRHAVPVEHGGTMGSENARAELNRAVPSRTQSAVEIFSQYPHFLAGVGEKDKAKSAPARRATASVSTSLTPAYASSSRSVEAPSGKACSTSSAGTATLKRDRLREFGISPEEAHLYEGKKLKNDNTRKLTFPELKGQLLLPDMMLKAHMADDDEYTNAGKPSSAPSGSSSFSARPVKRTASGGSRKAKLVREASEVSVSRGSARSGLGSVKEEGEDGEWHVQSETGAGSDSGSSMVGGEPPCIMTRAFEVKSEGGSKQKKGKRESRSASANTKDPKDGLSVTERRRLTMDSRTWSYDRFDGPMYDTMPQNPIVQIRREAVFVPDPPQDNASSSDLCHAEYIARSVINKDDTELERKQLREIDRCRGKHEGREGWWIEKEWEVKTLPRRKTLFLFGGS